MGDDLTKVSFDADTLRKKYNNYFVPAGRVLIGEAGKNLADTCGVQIENIRVSLNLSDAASATFSVTGIYDLGQHSISSSVKSELKLGNTVKIELGYESAYEDVFHGFIYETSVQFGDSPAMQVTAMDVKRLMSDNHRENYAWKGKTCSKIFAEMMGDYEALGLAVSADENTEEMETPMVQKGSDLSMVRHLCKTGNRIFSVHGGKVYFKKKDENKKEITTLSWGRDLISFSQSASYVYTKIQVWGNLKGSKKKEMVSAIVTSESGMKHVGENGTTDIITMTDVDSIDELNLRLDQEEETLKERVRSGSASCIGLPVLIPGRYIGITGLDEDLNGTYFIKSVSHSLGTDGFTTDLTFGGKL